VAGKLVYLYTDNKQTPDRTGTILVFGQTLSVIKTPGKQERRSEEQTVYVDDMRELYS
jgi:hypothetical protein